MEGGGAHVHAQQTPIIDIKSLNFKFCVCGRGGERVYLFERIWKCQGAISIREIKYTKRNVLHKGSELWCIVAVPIINSCSVRQ